jgi:hypothetical protein
MFFLAFLACAPSEIKLDDAEALAAACEDAADAQETASQTITFAAWNQGCAWGEDGNGDENDAHFQARREETASVILPNGAGACGLSLDFGAPDGGESTPMVYDDNFVFTFDGVVLATSYAPLLDLLPVQDGYYMWDWDAVLGTELSFDTSIPSWCLGEDEGVSTCDIPLPEQRGEMKIDLGDDIVSDLSFLAYSTGQYEFAFITLGDNDSTDCSHDDFSFSVEVPYVEL